MSPEGKISGSAYSCVRITIGLLQEHDASLAKAISIIYIVCGRKDEFLASLKSLHLFAKAAITSPEDIFQIHVISDDTVSPRLQLFSSSKMFAFYKHGIMGNTTPMYASHVCSDLGA